MMRRFLLDRTAAAGAEFALVLPLLLILLFGIIDTGRWLWTYNRAEKAVQMGVRFAAVANPPDNTLFNTKYVGVGTLTQGDLIPASAFGTMTCTDTSCTCTTNPCPAADTYTQADFRNVVDRMKAFLPEVGYSNVAIEYSSSGLGYAGNPNGPDLSPLITVKIGDPATPLPFTPITSFLFATFDMPVFRASMTAEDERGAQSN